MGFFGDEEQPILISYLDLYIYMGNQGYLNKKTIQKCENYKTDVLFGFPYFNLHVLSKGLWELGLNTNKEFEEITCFHRPKCMMFSSKQENKPIAYGLCFQGIERTDKEWLEIQKR